MMLPRVLARSMRSVSFLGVVVLAAPSALHLGVLAFFSGDFFRLLVSIFARVPPSSIPLEFGALLWCGASDPLR
jgi:hypothetical protein